MALAERCQAPLVGWEALTEDGRTRFLRKRREPAIPRFYLGGSDNQGPAQRR
jgi:hypothetical protein